MSDSCDQKCCGGSEADADHPDEALKDDLGDWVSQYSIPKMDCPSEERMIRMALHNVSEVTGLIFDLTARELSVVHNQSADTITEKLQSLGLGATLMETRAADSAALRSRQTAGPTSEQEATSLRLLLAINAVMFVVELTTGLFAQSAGLISDSLDMFADAAVYGLALFAVGHSARRQLNAARVAGVLQFVLALGVLAEVARRVVFGSEPESLLMMAVAFLALLANVACLKLISVHREGGAHMKASWIFSANDVLINVGVIVAGGLVYLTGSGYPDLIIGTIIGLIVLNGARRILALKA